MDVGDTIHDRFELKRRLGRGGMGDVWLAWDEDFERKVAIKFMIEKSVIGETDVISTEDYHDLRRRFEREGLATAALDHPAIPAVHHRGVWRGSSGGEMPYLVMQYIEGKTVEDLQEERGGFLEPEEAACLAVQLCSALAVAHDANVVHRDLKPANLMVGPSGMIKIIDFGVAFIVDSEKSRITRSRYSSPGTSGYVAPEVLKGASPGGTAADLYALGIVVYELLGGPVFRAATATDLDAAHLYKDPQPLCERRPTVPRDLGEAVDRLLIKDPAERLVGAREVSALMRRHVPAAGSPGIGHPAKFDVTLPFRTPFAPLARPDDSFRPPMVAVAGVAMSVGDAQLGRARELWDLGDRDAALRLVEHVMEEARREQGDVGKGAVRAWLLYAEWLHAAGRVGAAVGELRDMLRVFDLKLGRRDKRALEVRELLRRYESGKE
ncbi:serine/threonine-protein kinase [Nonomuraea jiangxiensis]|uniref:non-specific serine/threonine protein kinase n=1 Tax=Nonomuraea jiangxiensis TaxID=633440 RepID=A0A1G8TCB2_9ACTN|nr:serine/threonine-protein kinase [Nonomuraea jiangxiensis]SDJ39232.1 Serine/threonine protein kinase [Nonomuraea jiangxiensis]